MSETEPTPPVLYALWSPLNGWRETMNCNLLVAKSLQKAERLAKKYPGYRIVTLTPSLEVRGE